MLDRNGSLAICDKVDGQEENEQREAAVRKISDPEGNLWDEVSIGTQMLGAMRHVADTLAGNVSRESIERGSVGTKHGLSRESHQYERATCARLLAMFQLHAIFLL